MVEWKQNLSGDFFDVKLLIQPDLVFDSESNGRNLLARKKYFQFF